MHPSSSNVADGRSVLTSLAYQDIGKAMENSPMSQSIMHEHCVAMLGRLVQYLKEAAKVAVHRLTRSDQFCLPSS